MKAYFLEFMSRVTSIYHDVGVSMDGGGARKIVALLGKGTQKGNI